MLKKLPFIFLMLSSDLIAQVQPQPNQFDQFVTQSKIKWAAYASDSFYFDKALNDYLVCRLQNNEIKASLPVAIRSADANTINYLLKDSIDKLVLSEGNKLNPVYDSNGNVIRYSYFQKKPVSDNPSIHNITEVNQVLFIENGELKSYVPWVTPTLPLFMSSGKYLGETYYFNTAYNFKYNYKPKKRNHLIFLSQTNKSINLNDRDNELKSLYGRNLIETFWPYILQNKFEVRSANDNKIIDPASLTNNSLVTPTLVPLYDTNSPGKVYDYKIVPAAFNLKVVSELVVVQDWYYDETKNIVFNRVKELIIYMDKADKNDNKTRSPFIKILLK